MSSPFIKDSTGKYLNASLRFLSSLKMPVYRRRLWKFDIYHLLRFFDIKLNDDAPIARISYRSFSKGIIEVNPEVLKMSDANLIYILTHELLHFSLMHFDNELLRSLPSRFFANVIADIEVNAFIDRHLDLTPDFTVKKVLKNMKVSRDFFFFLYLLSGKEILKKFKSLTAFIKRVKCPDVTDEDIRHWVSFKKKLMEPDIPVTIEEIIEESTYWIENMAKVKVIVFIDDFFSSPPPEITDQILSGLSKLFKRTTDTLNSPVQNEDNLKETIWKLGKILKKAISEDPRSRINRIQKMAKRSVVPSVYPSRREIFQIKRGIKPVFHKREIHDELYTQGKVHLYVDVSGSFMDFLPFILGLMYHLKDYIGTPIYQFSTTVEVFKWDEVRSGKIKTTYGTDFNAVVNHALKNRFSRIVAITDGEFVPIHRDLLERYRSIDGEIHFVLPEERKDEEYPRILKRLTVTKSITFVKTGGK